MAPQTNGSSAIVKARGQRPPRCQCPDGAAGGPAIWTRGPSELRQMAVNVRTFCVRPSSRSPTPWLDVCGPGSSSAGGRSARLCAVSEAPEVTQVAFVHCPSPCAGWVHCPWSGPLRLSRRTFVRTGHQTTRAVHEEDVRGPPHASPPGGPRAQSLTRGPPSVPAGGRFPTCRPRVGHPVLRRRSFSSLKRDRWSHAARSPS
jgi:hypothetical protein